MSKIKTQIEELPNELLIYIFSFIHLKDLLKGWINLNNNINSIVQSTYISIQITNDDDLNDNLSSLKYFSSQIVYLKDERISPDNQIDICSLKNIRSFYLINYSTKQCENINPKNHRYLTRFNSLSLSWSFYERLLFSEDRFVYLKSIGCPRGGSILLVNMNVYPNLTIRHLNLKSASREMIIKFVEYLPNIISLTIDYLYDDSSISVIPLNKCFIRYLTIRYTCLPPIDFDQFLFSIGYVNLIEVRLSLNTCNFEKLSDILPKLSSLKRFQLRVYTVASDFDLISIRLLSPWFSSLDYEYVNHQGQQKRIVSLKRTRKQLD